jgi:hypothetical protein
MPKLARSVVSLLAAPILSGSSGTTETQPTPSAVGPNIRAAFFSSASRTVPDLVERKPGSCSRWCGSALDRLREGYSPGRQANCPTFGRRSWILASGTPARFRIRCQTLDAFRQMSSRSATWKNILRIARKRFQDFHRRIRQRQRVGPAGFGRWNPPGLLLQVHVAPACRQQFASTRPEQQAQREIRAPVQTRLIDQGCVDPAQLVGREEAVALFLVVEFYAGRGICPADVALVARQIKHRTQKCDRSVRGVRAVLFAQTLMQLEHIVCRDLFKRRGSSSIA